MLRIIFKKNCLSMAKNMQARCVRQDTKQALINRRGSFFSSSDDGLPYTCGGKVYGMSGEKLYEIVPNNDNGIRCVSENEIGGVENEA